MWQRSKIFPKDIFPYPLGGCGRKIQKIKVFKVRFGEEPVFGYSCEIHMEKGIAFSFTDPRKIKQSIIHPQTNFAVRSSPEFLKEYEFWTSAVDRREEIPQHILNDCL